MKKAGNQWVGSLSRIASGFRAEDGEAFLVRCSDGFVHAVIRRIDSL